MLYAGLSLNRQHMPMQSAHSQHTTQATHRHMHSPSPQHITWTGTAAAGGPHVHRHAPGKAKATASTTKRPSLSNTAALRCCRKNHHPGTRHAKAMHPAHRTLVILHQEHVMQRHALATTQPQPRPLRYARQACAVAKIAIGNSASIGVCQHQRAHTGTHITCAWAGADLHRKEESSGSAECQQLAPHVFWTLQQTT